MLSVIKLSEKLNITPNVCINIVRNKYWMRGKPPGVARTLEQRLAGEIYFEKNHFIFFKENFDG